MRRKIFHLAFCMLFLVAIAGCGKQKVSDIRVSELETVCDHLEAMELVVDEALVLVGDARSREALSAPQQAELDYLILRFDEISDAMRKLDNWRDREACGDLEPFDEKCRKINAFQD